MGRARYPPPGETSRATDKVGFEASINSYSNNNITSNGATPEVQEDVEMAKRACLLV